MEHSKYQKFTVETINRADIKNAPYNPRIHDKEAQKRLKDFCDQVQGAGHHFMLSNSDGQDGFFDDLYMQYHIDRVWASRSINADPKKRGKLTELLIRNYN